MVWPLPLVRQTRQVWPNGEEVVREHGGALSATAKWMQEVMRNLVSPSMKAQHGDDGDDGDGPQVHELQSVALRILAKKQRVSRAKLRASKTVRKVRAKRKAKAKPKGHPRALARPEGAAASSTDEVVVVAGSAVEPKAKAAPRAAAPPKANQVSIGGRMFTRLRRGGLSLQCEFHVGENCAKDIGYTPEVDEAEAVRRLLAWELCAEGLTRDEHVDRGGRRFGRSLRNCA